MQFLFISQEFFPSQVMDQLVTLFLLQFMLDWKYVFDSFPPSLSLLPPSTPPPLSSLSLSRFIGFLSH